MSTFRLRSQDEESVGVISGAESRSRTGSGAISRTRSGVGNAVVDGKDIERADDRGADRDLETDGHNMMSEHEHLSDFPLTWEPEPILTRRPRVTIQSIAATFCEPPPLVPDIGATDTDTDTDTDKSAELEDRAELLSHLRWMRSKFFSVIYALTKIEKSAYADIVDFIAVCDDEEVLAECGALLLDLLVDNTNRTAAELADACHGVDEFGVFVIRSVDRCMHDYSIIFVTKSAFYYKFMQFHQLMKYTPST